jgi:putative nucleotidyltransferase with HDIG domain
MPALDKIPAFPPVVLQVMQVLDRDDVGIPHLASVVSTDAAFSANILRLANSALFGVQAEIDNVGAAILVLGLDRLRSLAVTVITGNYMRAAFKVEELRRCWRHSLATAVIAARLGPAFKEHKDTAYTAGLLHDLGRLGLLVGYPERYTEILRRAGQDSLDLLDLEQREFGVDHCAAGRVLAEKWGLPQELVVIAGRHHDPDPDGAQPLLCVAHSACEIADALGYYVTEPLRPQSFEELCEKLPDDARRQLSVTQQELVEAIEDVIRRHDDDDFQAPGERPARHRTEVIQPEPAAPVAQGLITSWDALVVGATCVIFALIYFGISQSLR